MTDETHIEPGTLQQIGWWSPRLEQFNPTHLINPEAPLYDRDDVPVYILVPPNCDHCGKPIKVRGVNEPEYVHADTDSVFCTTYQATVDGRRTPPTSQAIATT
jgi:hypothetical protein